MPASFAIPLRSLRGPARAVIGLTLVWGALALLRILGYASDPENVVLLGLSRSRLVIFAAFIAAQLLFLLDLLLFLGYQRGIFASLHAALSSVLNFQKAGVWIGWAPAAGAVLLAAGLMAAANPLLQKSYPFLKYLVADYWPLFFWGILASGAYLALIEHLSPAPKANSLGMSSLSLLFLCGAALYLVALEASGARADFPGLRRLFPIAAGLSSYLLLWGQLERSYAGRPGYGRVQVFLMALGVFLFSLGGYLHLNQWLRQAGTPRTAYWHLLADAFLNGRLYLIDPPTTHDLTFYNGHWFVPVPPLPAILMMPYADLVGAARVNTVLFSVLVMAAANTLIYLCLDRMNQNGYLALPPRGMLAVVFLAGFGTTMLWVACDGRIWFVSQVVTVFFTALAAYLALSGAPPLLAGAAIGLAVTARPNAAVMALLILGIYLQAASNGPSKKTSFSNALRTVILVGIPVAAGAAALLVYNYLRFENFMDFGYVTINGNAEIVANAQAYGMFHPHFLAENLYTMFLRAPAFSAQFPFIHPSGYGMSMLLATPALLLLARRYPLNFWTAGAFLATAASLGLLALYHNTGAVQFGYRYISDFLVPLALLFGHAFAAPRGARLRAALVVLSVAVNIYGAFWFRFVV